MEKIDKHNYEAYWLDYIEGNLDEAATADLFAFLGEFPELKPDFFESDIIPVSGEQLHPEDKLALKHIPEEIGEKIILYLEGLLPENEKAAFEKDLAGSEFLQKDLKAYQQTFLGAGSESYPAKMQLKKTTLAEETIVAYFEGQLSPAERAKTDAILATDEVALYMLNAYQQTRLEADASVIFPDKPSLKQEAKVVRLMSYRTILAVAASVVLLFGLFRLLNRGSETEYQMDGSVALQKMKLSKRPVMHPEEGSSQDPQLAAHPGITNPSVKQPVIGKQKVILPKNNIAPQQQFANTAPHLNNPLSTPDTLGHKIAPSLQPAIEPRSLIAINPYKVNDSEMENPASTKVADPQRFNTTDYVAGQINKAAWGDEEVADSKTPPTDPDNYQKKKIKGFDVLALIGKGMKKLGNHRSDAKKIEDKGKDYTEYMVTIGSLSVSRKVAN